MMYFKCDIKPSNVSKSVKDGFFNNQEIKQDLQLHYLEEQVGDLIDR